MSSKRLWKTKTIKAVRGKTQQIQPLWVEIMKLLIEGWLGVRFSTNPALMVHLMPAEGEKFSVNVCLFPVKKREADVLREKTEIKSPSAHPLPSISVMKPI